MLTRGHTVTVAEWSRLTGSVTAEGPAQVLFLLGSSHRNKRVGWSEGPERPELI